MVYQRGRTFSHLFDTTSTHDRLHAANRETAIGQLQSPVVQQWDYCCSTRRGLQSKDEFCTYMQLKYKEIDESYTRSKHISFSLPATIRELSHAEQILRIYFTPDGTFIMMREDGTISFWSAQLQLRRSRRLFERPASRKPKWITDFTIMSQYNKFILSTGDREIQIYEMSTFEPYCQITGLETGPLQLDYCSTGEDDCMILYGDDQGCVNILRLSSVGETLRTWKKCPKVDNFPSISIENSLLSPNVTCIRWKVHDDWVTELKYYDSIMAIVSASNHEATALVIGCTTGTTNLEKQMKEMKECWKEGKGTKCHSAPGIPQKRLECDQSVFRVHKGVKTFDFCKKNNLIVTGGVDRIVRMWNPYVPGKPTGLLRGHCAPIFFLCISTDDDKLFSVSTDNTVKIWDIEDQCCLYTANAKASGIRGDVSACHYVAGIKALCIAADSIALLHLRIQPKPQPHRISSHKEPVLCCKYNSEFRQVISCSEGSVIKVWDLDTGSLIFEFSGAHGDSAICCMAFDDSGRRLITGGRDGCLKIWNHNNGHCLRILKKGEDWADFVSRLSQFFGANKMEEVDDTDRRQAMFLTVYGPKIYGLIKNLLQPVTAAVYVRRNDFIKFPMTAQAMNDRAMDFSRIAGFPKIVSHFTVACCKLHNLAIMRQQELVVEPEDRHEGTVPDDSNLEEQDEDDDDDDQESMFDLGCWDSISFINVHLLECCPGPESGVWILGLGDFAEVLWAVELDSGTSGCCDGSMFEVDCRRPEAWEQLRLDRLPLWSIGRIHPKFFKESRSDEICDCIYVEMHKNKYVLAVGWDRRINIYCDSFGDHHHIQPPQPHWQDDLKRGHKDDVLCIAQCLPTLLATSSYDGEIIVWNMISGHIYCHLQNPSITDCTSTPLADAARFLHSRPFDVAEFVVDLRRLAWPCKFGTALEDMPHDIFVIGINHEVVLRKLLAAETLDLSRAITIAQACLTMVDTCIIMSSSTSTATIESLRAMFATHGLPNIIVSDNGSCFTSLEFQEFMRLNGIKHVHLHSGICSMVDSSLSRVKSQLTSLAVSADDLLLYTADYVGYIYVYSIKDYAIHGPEVDPPKTACQLFSGNIPHSPEKCRNVDYDVGILFNICSSMELIEEQKVMVTSSVEGTVRLWSMDGEFIGTFGQPQPWEIYAPASWKHPMVPYEILIDPLSMPIHPMLEEETSVIQLINLDQSEENKQRTESKDLQHKSPTVVISDDDIKEEIQTKTSQNNLGKRMTAHLLTQPVPAIVAGSQLGQTALAAAKVLQSTVKLPQA
uniref:uncharacterized protein n=1 Tax=Pristiophorus japonicus TaxID=55135 RepID=UPI00398F589E